MTLFTTPIVVLIGVANSVLISPEELRAGRHDATRVGATRHPRSTTATIGIPIAVAATNRRGYLPDACRPLVAQSSIAYFPTAMRYRRSGRKIVVAIAARRTMARSVSPSAWQMTAQDRALWSHRCGVPRAACGRARRACRGTLAHGSRPCIPTGGRPA